MKTIEYILLISCIFVIGCVASGKLSGTGINSIYGTANSINAEVDLNGTK